MVSVTSKIFLAKTQRRKSVWAVLRARVCAFLSSSLRRPKDRSTFMAAECRRSFAKRRNGSWYLFAILSLVASSSWAGNQPTVVFMTDFGVIDDSVAICKGVMLKVEPSLRIVDLTHQVTPYSILDGARFLAGASPYFPAGTVFVTVIDPGVGSTRKAVVVKTKKDQFFVLPDNGLITLVAQRDGVDGVREIQNKSWMIGSALSSTFHGRDIFSPVGAHLAKGEDWTQAGPEIPDFIKLKVTLPKVDDQGITGEIIALDGPYGNLVSNIDAEDFHKLNYGIGEKVKTKIGQRFYTIPFVKTFSDVPLHQALLYVDSRGHIAIAINQGNFAKTFAVQPPVPLFFAAKK
jgi:S-adenosylmethionine hydrolase